MRSDTPSGSRKRKLALAWLLFATSLIGAVTRAQLPPCTIGVRGQRGRDGQAEGLRLHIEAVGLAGQRAEGPLNIDRGGLGLDVPIAEAVIALHRGRVLELTAVGRCVGMIVWLPVAP